ncbi:MAG: hypothetical protein FWD39_02270 [Clostridiales bacterium]|nr:hypothetical protein [Clostridiales bacterium]
MTKNEQIIDSWNKVKPDQAKRDRLLNDIFTSARAERPSRAGAGLRFSLRTLLVAIAIVALSATSAFAAYSAGVNAAQPPADVEQLNEMIAALQEQVAVLNEEIEELRGQINATQYGSKTDMPDGKSAFLIDLNLDEGFGIGIVAEQNKFSSMSETIEYIESLGAPFKVPGWTPEVFKGREPGMIGALFLSELTNELYPVLWFYYPGGLHFTFSIIQYHFGPDHQVNIHTIHNMETVMVGDIEVTVIYQPNGGRMLFWMDDDGVFTHMSMGGPSITLADALAIIASMSAPVSAE